MSGCIYMSNIQNVEFIVNKLGELKQELVFVGGAIVELLLDKQ